MQELGVGISGDEQHAGRGTGFDQTLCQRETVDEPGAPLVDVHSAAARGQSEPGLHGARCSRQEVVGALRAEDEKVDRTGIAGPPLEEPLGGRNAEIGSTLLRRRDPPSADAGCV